MFTGFVDVIAHGLQLGLQAAQRRRRTPQVAVALFTEQLDAVAPGGGLVVAEVDVSAAAAYGAGGAQKVEVVGEGSVGTLTLRYYSQNRVEQCSGRGWAARGGGGSSMRGTEGVERRRRRCVKSNTAVAQRI